jgi:hypothetical protein
MNPGALLEFLRIHRLAVQSSASAAGAVQAAIVGFAVTDRFEIAMFRRTSAADPKRSGSFISRVLPTSHTASPWSSNAPTRPFPSRSSRRISSSVFHVAQ